MVFPNFSKLNDDAILPIFGNADFTNAGLDFYASEDMDIRARSSASISTGITWNPRNTNDSKIFMEMGSRSGLSFKHDIEVGAGKIDQGYRGEIKVKLYNNEYKIYHVKKGDRIAQGIIKELPDVYLEHQAPEKVERGDKGFGSTGT